MTKGLAAGPDGRPRCAWAVSDPLYLGYHDQEWGRPVTDEQGLFERLCLEAFQAGLSWLVILRKRAAFREAFVGFDPERVAAFDDADVARLLGDTGIVRNRAKISATIRNARAVLSLADVGQSLSELLWSFAPPPRPRPERPADIPATTAESQAMAKALKAQGFSFVGPTTCYALMQAVGMVDDHLTGCHVRSTRDLSDTVRQIPE